MLSIFFFFGWNCINCVDLLYILCKDLVDLIMNMEWFYSKTSHWSVFLICFRATHALIIFYYKTGWSFLNSLFIYYYYKIKCVYETCRLGNCFFKWARPKYPVWTSQAKDVNWDGNEYVWGHPLQSIIILIWATRARHVLASMLNSDIRSTVEPIIGFTHNINTTSTINSNWRRHIYYMSWNNEKIV